MDPHGPESHINNPPFLRKPYILPNCTLAPSDPSLRLCGTSDVPCLPRLPSRWCSEIASIDGIPTCPCILLDYRDPVGRVKRSGKDAVVIDVTATTNSSTVAANATVVVAAPSAHLKRPILWRPFCPPFFWRCGLRPIPRPFHGPHLAPNGSTTTTVVGNVTTAITTITANTTATASSNLKNFVTIHPTLSAPSGPSWRCRRPRRHPYRPPPAIVRAPTPSPPFSPICNNPLDERCKIRSSPCVFKAIPCQSGWQIRWVFDDDGGENSTAVGHAIDTSYLHSPPRVASRICHGQAESRCSFQSHPWPCKFVMVSCGARWEVRWAFGGGENATVTERAVGHANTAALENRVQNW